MKIVATTVLYIATLFGFAQGINSDNISHDDFFYEKKIDSSNFIQKVNQKYQNKYVKIEFKTGTEFTCRKEGKYNRNAKNSFTIINNDITKTDIWVLFERFEKMDTYNGMELPIYYEQRKCFVKYGEQFTIKYLPYGKYKLAIIHGNEWMQPLNNRFCLGQFTSNNYYISYPCTPKFTIDKYSNHTYTSLNDSYVKDDPKTHNRTCLKRQ